MLIPSRQLNMKRPEQGPNLKKNQRPVQDNHPDQSQNLTRLRALVRLLARQAAHQVYLSLIPHPFVDRLKRSDSTDRENREEE